MDLTEIKKKIDKNSNIEDIHAQLAEMDDDVAYSIVSSMSDKKVYLNVNLRQFQADYICDYLEYLWDISEKDFWKHVMASFDLSEGLLWSDNMVHCRKMQDGPIPDEVWGALIHFALKVEEQRDVDALVCVIKGQLDFRTAADVYTIVDGFPAEQQEVAKIRAKYLLESPCTYSDF